MKLRLVTTHLDRHGERFTLGALKSIVEQSNKYIIPIGIEHDPRITPKGRVIMAELVELEDGEFAVEGVVEFFDDDFENLTDTYNREIPVRIYKYGNFKIVTDRNFRDENSKKDIEDLKSILKNAKTEEEIKKSLEPISILTLGSGFVLGGIANGFLGEIGAEAYRALVEKLKQIYNKPVIEEQEKLFKFDTTITKGKKSVNVQVIISNPTVNDIQVFFDKGIKQLDIILLKYIKGNKHIKVIVFEYKSNSLELKFALSKKGIPIELI
ncbi:hypothetical protein VR611_06190 [Aquirufa nivalisilvae]